MRRRSWGERDDSGAAWSWSRGGPGSSALIWSRPCSPRGGGSGWSTTSPPAGSQTSTTSKGDTSGPRGTSSRSTSPGRRSGGGIRLPSGGDPERPAFRPRAEGVARQAGPTATLNVLEAARLTGRLPTGGLRRLQQRLRRHRRAPQARGDACSSPLSPYAAGKLAGEHYVHVYARTMGLDGVSLRYFNIFGPRQDPSSPYSGVISVFAKRMAAGERPTIYGDGSQTRDFTYVANAVSANLLAMKSPAPLLGEAYNVGTGGGSASSTWSRP